MRDPRAPCYTRFSETRQIEVYWAIESLDSVPGAGRRPNSFDHGAATPGRVSINVFGTTTANGAVEGAKAGGIPPAGGIRSAAPCILITSASEATAPESL